MADDEDQRDGDGNICNKRTDGDRLLVFTNSGQADLKEAYAFRMQAGADGKDEVIPEKVKTA